MRENFLITIFSHTLYQLITKQTAFPLCARMF